MSSFSVSVFLMVAMLVAAFFGPAEHARKAREETYVDRGIVLRVGDPCIIRIPTIFVTIESQEHQGIAYYPVDPDRADVFVGSPCEIWKTPDGVFVAH